MADGGGAQDILEATAMLSALASTTSQIRLANMVLSMTYRHPAVLANWAVTVDRISAGRLTLGVGAAGSSTNTNSTAWRSASPVSASTDSPRTGRARRPAEPADTTFAGRYYQLTDAECDPKPMQSSLPLLVGATEPRMLRLTARYANEESLVSPRQLPDDLQALDAACDRRAGIRRRFGAQRRP
jgi:alkanesulfonate monooxygenase SsuD/methylene tetrahydromethanopterin reductase-like flavin-dependent oxidoreductase (luciferase family)